MAHAKLKPWNLLGLSYLDGFFAAVILCGFFSLQSDSLVSMTAAATGVTMAAGCCCSLDFRRFCFLGNDPVSAVLTVLPSDSL